MLNKVMLIGNLGADPETRYMPNGDPVATLRLATTRKWKDKNTGEKKEEVEWHRVVLFSGLAKIASEYLKKGSQVYIEGRIRTQKWQGQDGQEKYTTEIVADSMNMLGGKGNAQQSNPPAQQSAQPPVNDYDDDIPF